MYFKSIELENVGPIEKLKIEFPQENERPKPVIIVGENGSGKSILLSHLVNSLIVGKQEVFEDVEVEKGRVYKLRSPNYVQSGKDYSFSLVELFPGVIVEEWQLRIIKSDFEKRLGYIPNRDSFKLIPEREGSLLHAAFRDYKNEIIEMFTKQCCLYFPTNRFEEPAWLNIGDIRSKVTYTDLKLITGYSNRSIVCVSPLKDNRNWLLDLILDRQVFETVTAPILHQFDPDIPATTVNMFVGYFGPSANLLKAVTKVLKVILRKTGNIRLGAGTRKQRLISVMKDEVPWIPDLFQLSTGEVQLLNLFLSIVRDYDLSEGEFKDLGNIKGVVIIDEIDAHLHTIHQKEVLPELISLFPNVQFIITTHAPLFLLGMEEKFSSEGFVIINMPNGEQVTATDFSEFAAAYEAFKETVMYRDEIRTELERYSQPIVFVEGDCDIRYLTKAAELLGRSETLEKIQLKDGGGFGNLDKIWNSLNNPISDVLPNKVLLLYDCDAQRTESNKGLVYRRNIRHFADSPISKGIENLFSSDTIQRVEELKPQFIDVHESKDRTRGKTIIKPVSKSVNKDEKSNMCTWLCEHGNSDDFANFEVVFQLIEEIISS